VFENKDSLEFDADVQIPPSRSLRLRQKLQIEASPRQKGTAAKIMELGRTETPKARWAAISDCAQSGVGRKINRKPQLEGDSHG
jgi:hypothetical protein